MIEIDLLKKHTKKALGLAEHHPPHTWRQRLPEILLEIGIIVFAITLSIQLHAWHERSLNRAEEREFLTGLQADLQEDLGELRQDSLAYVRQHQQFNYLLRVATKRAPLDSLPEAQQALNSASELIPNDSRFEGFKSAGKLGLIENPKLSNLIVELYQERIPSLRTITHYYTSFISTTLGPYLDEYLTPSASNLPSLLATNRMQNYLHRGQNTRAIVERYHLVLQQSRAIIREINQQEQEK